MFLASVAIFLIVFCVISLRRLDWAMMIVLASLPIYVVRFSVLGLPTTLLEVMILIIFAVWATRNYGQIFKNVKLKINKEELKNNRAYPFGLELILVLIIAFIAMGVSGFSDSAMGIWKAYFFEPIIIYLLVFNILFRPKKKEEFSFIKIFSNIILPLSVSAFVVSLFAIYQKITGDFIPNELWAASETRRVTSFFGYPNAVGLFLAPVSMMMFGYLLAVRDKYKKQSCGRIKCTKWSPFSLKWFKIMPWSDKLIFLFLKFSSALSILAIYFARSEGALIAILVAMFLIVIFTEPINRIGKIRAIAFTFFVFVIIAFFSFVPLREFAINRLQLNDFSGQIRKAQWQDTGIMLRDNNYLMGAGLAGYQNKIEPYHSGGIYIKNNDPDFEHLIKVSPEYQKKHWQALEIFLYPHNIFLNFWVELGLVGMLIFIWIILKVFYLSLRLLFVKDLKSENRFLLLGAMSAMLVLVVHGIVDVPYFKNDLAVIFWLIVALVGIFSLSFPVNDSEGRESPPESDGQAEVRRANSNLE